MTEEQPIIAVTPGTLVGEVKRHCEQGWRLVQIGAAKLGELFEINYSFDRDLVFQNLRVQIPETAARLPSISGVYWCAFLYENEIHDLYGITFDGLVLDFKGTLYKTAIPAPFAVKPETPGVSASVVQPRV
ncbi:MAG TPA: NADH-quinone oxidoreductase subunit C [Kiritimatiellia bacterium]|nr:NADH-quinone oxidoreductase subunit C [Kiritimatiellia bacterium]HPS08981.1 NADH-quinone oxidoreductase subunit C [Kiritimatiellia bacterium]